VVIRSKGNEGHGKTCPHWRGPTGEEPAVRIVEVERPRPVYAVPVRQVEIEPAIPEAVEELEGEKSEVQRRAQRAPRLSSAPMASS